LATGRNSAKAHFDAPERVVHIRVCGLDGHLYLDLADETWRAVEIDATGWRVGRRLGATVRFTSVGATSLSRDFNMINRPHNDDWS
jgi:hypothetical protein